MSLLQLLQQETGKIGLLIDPDKTNARCDLTKLIETIQAMQALGVNLIVIGTAFEENPSFFF